MASFILGGGMTGLAAGMTANLPVLEAAAEPGGICSSYYISPGSRKRLANAPKDGDAYRFEKGGGHWIFGGDPEVLSFIKDLTPVKNYTRNSSVYFRKKNLTIPYPLQKNLNFLEQQIAANAMAEMVHSPGPAETMAEWLKQRFGSTLCEMFFTPFHERYTAGLFTQIAPQDDYKSPAKATPAAGYNVQFIYPVEGLNELASRMAERCDILYRKCATKIDVKAKKVYFTDGSFLSYERLISTLPLNRMIEMTGLRVTERHDPYTSVLVLNIGAQRGECCPEDHWLYVPDSESAFHRIGFYSNVDTSFLPVSTKERNDRVSLYIERTYLGGTRPGEEEIARYAQAVVKELQSLRFIQNVEVVDPSWIDVAYTWSWPGSSWKQQALCLLEENDIYQTGRFGRWVFQGIADSIRDGFLAGAHFKQNVACGTK